MSLAGANFPCFVKFTQLLPFVYSSIKPRLWHDCMPDTQKDYLILRSWNSRRKTAGTQGPHGAIS
ncbi:hypothetical protein BDV34DRAFT_201649 [Aspergillus parasiticus]|uniref:Uncharacterized protein n=1 Tax=Aspergillus parasiticus TaxID=5067 RepID=A0A5N6DA83_ASPPA|nr:hypothetical protein BDV34DRAFT_201649 [Aspergillus parasiticus]